MTSSEQGRGGSAMKPHDLRPEHIGERITITDTDGTIIASGRLQSYSLSAEREGENQ